MYLILPLPAELGWWRRGSTNSGAITRPILWAQTGASANHCGRHKAGFKLALPSGRKVTFWIKIKVWKNGNMTTHYEKGYLNSQFSDISMIFSKPERAQMVWWSLWDILHNPLSITENNYKVDWKSCKLSYSELSRLLSSRSRNAGITG